MRSYLSVLSAVLVLGMSLPAAASDADFKLRNKTGYQIDEVYVSGHSSHNWGRDVMGSDALADGEVVNITFPHNASACHYDIKVKYNDGDTAEWSDINLCNYSEISLFWNSRDNTTRAVGK